MVYVVPTAATFKARFPEFAAVSDALIEIVLAEAIDKVGPTWGERDRQPAQLYLTAHLLTLEGEPGRTTAGAGGAQASTGAIKRFTVGDVTTEFVGVSGGAGGGDTGASYYLSTTYGARYWKLLKLNFAGMAVV